MTTAAKSSQNSTSPLAELAVLGVAVVWGASYPVAKGALGYAPFLLLIFYRFLTTTIVMGAAAHKEIVQACRRDIGTGVVLGTILFSIYITETSGIIYTSATNAALVISLCTVLTPFLEFGLQRRLPPTGILIGATLAVAGVAMLGGGVTPLGIGDILIFCAACLRAVMVVSTKRLMTGARMSSGALTAVQAATVTGLALALLLTEDGPRALLVRAGPEFWGSVMFLSLFCTVAAFYVQNTAVRRTSPSRVALLMGTEPLFGFLFAWALLSEPATSLTFAGAALIIGGTMIGLAWQGPLPARCRDEDVL